MKFITVGYLAQVEHKRRALAVNKLTSSDEVYFHNFDPQKWTRSIHRYLSCFKTNATVFA